MSSNNIISQQCCACQNTYQGTKMNPFPKNTIPGSIASEDCTNNQHKCNHRRILSFDQGPTYPSGKQYQLNQNIHMKKVSGFYPSKIYKQISDQNGKAQYVVDQNCKSNVYATFTDPRLRNTATGDLIKLDSIPYGEPTKLEDVYNEELRNYGNNYRSYQDINAGNIIYKINEEDNVPFQKPNFTLESTTTHTVFEDPMGALIPEYYSMPLNNNNVATSDYQDTRDELSHREDIMTGIMHRHNKTNYSTLWYNTIPKQ